MSFNNIVNIVRSLSGELDKLSEDEEAKLYFYLGSNETVLAEVENLCNLLQKNSAKLKYLILVCSYDSSSLSYLPIIPNT
jgi:hypothetical protein